MNIVLSYEDTSLFELDTITKVANSTSLSNFTEWRERIVYINQ